MNKARQLKKGELTTKDMSVLREGDDARTQSKKQSGVLRDYSLQHRVAVRWGMNPDAENDRMFILKVDDYEVILDAEEVLRYCRWI